MTILDLVSARRVASTRGGEYVGPCPKCGGEDRFLVWPCDGPTGSFSCLRGCHYHGDGIQLARDQRGLSYVEACALLGIMPKAARRSGRGGRPRRGSAWKRPSLIEPAAVRAPRTLPPEKWRSTAAKVQRYAAEQLEGEAGVAERERLTSRYGLTMETARTAGLGALGLRSDGRWLGQDGSVWGLEPVGKDSPPPRVYLPPGILIPRHGEDGTPIRLRIRLVDGVVDKKGEPLRFLMVRGSCGVPLVIPGREPSTAWAVTESELDAWLTWQEAGHLVNVVGLGSVSTRPDTDTAARLSAATTILLMLDQDKAGAREAIGWWLRRFRQTRLAVLASFKDPSEAWREGVPICRWVERALAQRPAALSPGPRRAAPAAPKPAALAIAPVAAPVSPDLPMTMAAPPVVPAPDLIPAPAHETDLTWPPTPGACWMCGGIEFHLGYGGKRICCRCHPPVSITVATRLPAAAHEGNARVGA